MGGGFWIALGLAALVSIAVLALIWRKDRREEVKEAGQDARKEVRDELQIKNLSDALDVHRRADAVPDRLPEPDPAKPATERRRGRRGPV